MILIIIGVLMLLIGIGLTIGGVVVWIQHRSTKVPTYTWVLLGVGIAMLVIGGIMAIWGISRRSSSSSTGPTTVKTTQERDLVFGMNV